VASREGNTNYYQLGALAALAVAAKGPILLLANSGETLKSRGSGKSESLVVEDRGAQSHQTVAYRLKK
jgi:hypothetical protein